MPTETTAPAVTGLTPALHADLVALAGDDFTYPGVRGGSKPPGGAKKGLRTWLAEQQGGCCPVCGDALRFAQINHVVSRGPKVLGFIPGNVFAGCALCNLDCALTYGQVDEDGNILDGGIVPLSHFARPDLINVAAHPGATALTRIARGQ